MKTSRKFSPFLLYVLSLVVIGFFFISISSLFEAQSSLGDAFFFIRKQAVWIGLGYLFILFCSRFEINKYKHLSFYLYLFSVFLLIVVLIPGIGTKVLGARRWINLGFTTLQPSELFKFSSLIFFSALFSEEQHRTFKKLLLFLLPPFFLIVLEPNLSTALLCTAITVSIYYLSGGPYLPLFFTFIIFTILGSLLIVLSPYRMARFTQGYHSQQIIYSLASGGIFGKGIANSDQKYKFLPKISTDSILAVIGEETGFIGLSALIFLFTSLISYLFRLAKVVTDSFEKLVVLGLACWLSYQALINLAAIVSLIPLTGIPFPFVSYGGSSLLTLFIASGLVRNIEKRHLKLLYSNSGKSAKNTSHRHPSHSRP